MPDRYGCYRELERANTEGVDYRVEARQVDGTDLLVLAPHGGGIEPGTSEIAKGVAGSDASLYLFEGLKASGNRTLHITSTNFDEPRCLSLLASAARVLAIHGEGSSGELVLVGGRDTVNRDSIAAAFGRHGFTAGQAGPGLRGEDPANVCNRGTRKLGVQLEISEGLRRTLFRDLTAAGRRAPTSRLLAFVGAIREGLLR